MALALPGVEEVVVVRVGEGGHDDPFCDLGPVDAGAGRKGDAGGGVNRGVGNVVGTRGREVDQTEVRGLRGFRERGQGYEECCIVVDV